MSKFIGRVGSVQGVYDENGDLIGFQNPSTPSDGVDFKVALINESGQLIDPETRQVISSGSSTVLGDLALSTATFSEDVAQGSIISAITGKTSGSTLSTADSRFAIDGSNNLVRGLGAVSVGATTVDIVETLSGATKTNNLALTIAEAQTQTLRVVTQNNELPRASEGRTGTDSVLDRYPHRVGSGAINKIAVAVTNNAFGASGAITALDACTYRGWIEYNNVVVPLTFSGSSTLSLASGDNDIVSDEIDVTAFGVTEIPIDAEIWTTETRESDVLSQPYGFCNRDIRAVSGSQRMFYSKDDTTLGNLDGVGEVTFTGGTQSGRIAGAPSVILGKFVTGDPTTMVAVGDSITVGVGESREISSVYGGGWFKRMLETLHNNTVTAGLNTAVSGATSSLALRSELQAYFKYASHGAFAFGTNDIGQAGNGNVSTLRTNCNSIIAAMKSAGVATVGVAELPPRAYSTDLWATAGNQTALDGWDELTDNGYVWNSTILTDTNADYVLGSSSVRDASDQFIWKSDGSDRAFAYDGTHPSAGGYAALAAERKAQVLANLT